MKMLVCSIIMSAFLQVSSPNPMSCWTLLPNILVVEVNGFRGEQPLSCLGSLGGGDREERDIFWKKNGVKNGKLGNLFSVQLEESLGGGNYTCHRKDGSLVNHTEVLIQEDETKRRKILVETDNEEYLKCSAQNYDGEFHCSWTWHASRVSKVAFVKVWRISDDRDAQCSVDSGARRWTCSSGRSNFSCSLSESGHGISCLDEQHCPYAEESQRIYISVYVRTEDFLLENYSKQFYLSEIVKPDAVTISKVNTTMIEWRYPSSWSSPYSFFPLTFQIVQLRRGCKRCDNPCIASKATETLTVRSADVCQFRVEPKAKAVCVRAQDALCNSQWSKWSHFRLRHKKNKKDQQQYKQD